ncbi:serine hydrolase domain-containing protein [Nonomuraea sp. NPDC050328]|uniref:serine hydrolase domain-containing protein n=1 Tax=Nonomuraea sp. NPDC050328 TaxID=3364361 RepID=UPI0037B80984
MPRHARLLSRTAAAASLAVFAALPAPAAAATPYEQLKDLARQLVAAGAPGVIVRVDDGRGRPVEIAEQAPWTRRDHVLKTGDEFRVGSNTKTMTATLVLQLVAEGRLALTDPVEKWLPGQVPNGSAITLRMLLNHTSGLADYTEEPALLPSILGKDRRRWTSAELLAVGVKQDPLFKPGKKWAYSNTGYAALGAVLERVTGKSLADLVRDRIARPLGLEHTYVPTGSSWRGSYARGYEKDAAHQPPAVPVAWRALVGPRRNGHIDVSANSPSWGGAAGSVVSSAGDWSRFTRALMSGKLLPATQLAQLRTLVPIDPQQPDGPGYGLGIQSATTPCGTFWGHDGGMPGYLTVGLTDRTGSRAATVLIATEYWSEFGADAKLAKAAQALQLAAICSMFAKPVPRG